MREAAQLHTFRPIRRRLPSVLVMVDMLTTDWRVSGCRGSGG
jgi:hypothetical protein